MMGNVQNPNTISSLQMDPFRHLPNNDIDGEQWPSSTLVRLNELEIFRCYLILSMERLNLDGIDGVFMSLRQSHRSHIYTAIPSVVFDAQIMREINSGVTVATVVYVGTDLQIEG